MKTCVSVQALESNKLDNLTFLHDENLHFCTMKTCVSVQVLESNKLPNLVFLHVENLRSCARYIKAMTSCIVSYYPHAIRVKSSFSIQGLQQKARSRRLK